MGASRRRESAVDPIACFLLQSGAREFGAVLLSVHLPGGEGTLPDPIHPIYCVNKHKLFNVTVQRGYRYKDVYLSRSFEKFHASTDVRPSLLLCCSLLQHKSCSLLQK